MAFNEQVLLLCIGAGIALTSSLLTTLFTSLMNQWLLARSKRAEKKERIGYLVGKAMTRVQPSEGLLSNSKEAEELILELMNDITSVKLDVYSGALEAVAEDEKTIEFFKHELEKDQQKQDQ
jgi:hypothetical protein